MKKKKIELNLEYLLLALRMNPESVSFDSLRNGFEINKKDEPELVSALTELENKSLIIQNASGHYQATKPISDLVIVRLKQKPTGKSVPVEILGIKGEMPFVIAVPAKQIRKLETKEGKKLTQGSHIAIILERSKNLEFKSRRIIGRVERGKKLHLTVSFTKSATPDNPTVTSFAPMSLTTFNAVGKIPAKIDPRKDFRATLPLDYDPATPILELEDLKWDPKTGAPIYSIVARKHGIPVRHSSEANLEAKKMSNANFWKDKSRRDLRNERILVVDPVNAHDHDDGIFIEHTDKKIDGQRAYYRTLVVIADMPFFIRPGSRLEKEAIERGFTHYFGDNALHLYPSIFADRKASLKTGKMRPVIYVEKFWDAEGKQIGVTDISSGIIESQKTMTYGQFQDLIDVSDPSIWPYQELGDKLIQKYRHENGVVFDGTDQDMRASYARALVASMMQDANQEIAEFLDYYNLTFLRRSHGAKENLYAYEECKEALQKMGYEIPDSPFEISIDIIQDILSRSEENQERPSVERYIKQYLLNQAKYTTADVGHFALNMPRYTHATSPIRRYPDLLTLRAVHTATGDRDLGLSKNDIETMDDIAVKMNRLQDIQRMVALDYERYFSVGRLASQEGFQRNVTLAGIKYPHIHIDISLGKKGGSLRKEIHFSELSNAWSIHPSHNKLLYQGNHSIPIGSTLKVTITNVNPERGEWGFTNMIPSPKTLSLSHSTASRIKGYLPQQRVA